MMGNHFSKKPRPQLDSSNSTSNGGSSSSSGSNPSNNNNINYKKELNSYELECQQDPTLQNFDTALHNRTITAISVLATSEISSLPFDTFSQITGGLLDNNQEVVKIILDYKEDIWNNPEFFDLVKDYFENSLQTLDFCTSLEKCLKKARDSQFIIQLALQLFEEEEGEEGGGGKKYSKTLEELQHFKAVGDPFTEEFYQLFEMVYKNQVAMLERLKQRKKKLDKKLKSVKAWRTVSSIIFVSAFAAVLICSVVAATMAAPPVAAALAAAASIPLGSVGKWIDNLWRDYTNVLKGEKGVISIMEFGTKFAINDLKSIRVLVDRLENEIRALVMNVDFAMRDEERVRFGIEEIKKKLGVFMKSIEDLGKEVDKSTRDIQRARTVVLQRIVKYPK